MKNSSPPGWRRSGGRDKEGAVKFARRRHEGFAPEILSGMIGVCNLEHNRDSVFTHTLGERNFRMTN